MEDGSAFPAPLDFPNANIPGQARIDALPVVIPAEEVDPNVPAGQGVEQVTVRRVLCITKNVDHTNMDDFGLVDQAANTITHFYEIMRRLKTTNYGDVLHALQLQPDGSQNNTGANLQLRRIFIQDPQSGGSMQNIPIAIKRSSTNMIQQQSTISPDNPLREIAALQFIGHHDFVMSHLECALDHAQGQLYCCMDYYDGGELYETVEDNNGLEEGEARAFFHQILLGLQHSHAHGVAHRDLTLENVIVKRNGIRAKIIDYGMAIRVPMIEHTNTYATLAPQGTVGKRHYMAPEVLKNRPLNPIPSDIWALGIILFSLLAGFPPFDLAAPMDARYRLVTLGSSVFHQQENDANGNGTTDMNGVDTVVSGLAELVTQWGLNLTPSAVDLCARILREDPTQRLTLEQIVQHPWTNGQ